MPPMGRNLIDQEGVALLAERINALAPNMPPAVALPRLQIR
jgi:hypothetical protein